MKKPSADVVLEADEVQQPEPEEKLEVTILPVDRHKLAVMRKDWETTLKTYEVVPCASTEDHALWVEWRNHAHEVLKESESDRTEVTGPMNIDLKLVNKWFADGVANVKLFKELANKKIGAFELAQDAAAKAARQAAQLAAQAGDHEAVYEALATAPSQDKVAGNSTRFVWEPELVDESVLDRRFMSYDPKKVAAYAKGFTTDVGPVAPGLKFTRIAKTQPTGGKRK